MIGCRVQLHGEDVPACEHLSELNVCSTTGASPSTNVLGQIWRSAVTQRTFPMFTTPSYDLRRPTNAGEGHTVHSNWLSDGYHLPCVAPDLPPFTCLYSSQSWSYIPLWAFVSFAGRRSEHLSGSAHGLEPYEMAGTKSSEVEAR